MLVSGEAGIGKSVLVRRFCDAQRGHARVLWGACDALVTPRPLSPLIDIAATVQGAVLTCVREGEKPYGVFAALVEEVSWRRAEWRQEWQRAAAFLMDSVRWLVRRAGEVAAVADLRMGVECEAVLVDCERPELGAQHARELDVDDELLDALGSGGAAL